MSTGPTRAVRELVLARDSYSCVSCGRHVGGYVDYSIHHRIARGMGGSSDPRLNLPSNLITLCGSGVTGCHGWVESHRNAARGWGYLLHRLDEPSLHFVFAATGWTRYADDGGISYPPTDHLTPSRLRRLEQDAERARLERMGQAA